MKYIIVSKNRYQASNKKEDREDSIFDSVNMIDSHPIEDSSHRFKNMTSPLQLKHLVDHSHQACKPFKPKNLNKKFSTMNKENVADVAKDQNVRVPSN